MVAIVDNPESEAKRLGSQGFSLKVPTEIEPKFVNGITSIDGAILMGIDGKCYSLGVILDGIASDNSGDMSRGARYNSAIKYLDLFKDKYKEEYNCIVVVISEDGMINIFPEDLDKIGD